MTRAKGIMVTVLASFVLWAALGLLITSKAEASPLSYTQYHCIKFARAVQAERWGAGVTQIRYLSRSYTINSVERWADAWLYNPIQYNINGLVRGCYNAVY